MAESPDRPEASSPEQSPPEQSPASKQPSPDRLFVQNQIVQPLIQWIPLGASGWLFASFLLKQEWAQVLLTFPVTIVTAVWAAYSKNFVDRLSEIYAERGKKDADALMQGLTNLDETLKWQLSGFDDKYLQLQATECQALRSEGVVQRDRIFTPLLKEVFVDLTLDISDLSPGLMPSKNTEFSEPIERRTDIWEILRKTTPEPMFRQLAILAWGGYGKTTLLKHITYLYGTKQQPRSAPKLIPVLLILRKYRDLLSGSNPPSLPELITKHHIPGLPDGQNLQVPPHWAKDILKRGDALVMLDGFDEVAKDQRPAVARWITEQLHQYGKSVFIVTSRPKAYREQQTGDRLEMATTFWVKEFDESQRQNFVQKWYLSQERYAHGGRNTNDVQKTATAAAADLLEQIEARQELKDLAQNPLLLNMIVTFHRRFPGAELPKRRVDLYQEICLLQLRDRPAARKLETLLSQGEAAQTILQMLALWMMLNRLERLERAQLLKCLAGLLQHQKETVDAKEFLEQIVQISELLVEREPDEFEFTHLSFQEYLAATQIVRSRKEKLLYDYFHDDWWKSTILLYAAQVKPENLIREMVQRGAVDLAAHCLYETTKRIDPALKQAVHRSRCAKLEAYLKQQQWKEADKETYRLMITTIGKDEGQWFEPEELLNFPCEALRTIDQLWVKYSKGHFGFSVQKQIYVECGAKLDGKYPGDEIWEKFGDCVGWRNGSEWLNYSELNPSFSSPGIFPARAGGWGVGLAGVLFSRTETCEL